MELLMPEIGLLIWAIFCLLTTIVLFLVALVNALKSNFADSITKLMWVLVIVLVPVAGPVIYLIVGRRARIEKPSSMIETV